MTVIFYTYTGRRNAVTKTLSGGVTKSGQTLPGYQDLSAPVIQVSSDSVPSWNYAYIQEFNKYYYLSSPRWISGNVYEFTCTLDVLMTYRTEIRAQSGIVRYSLLGSMGISDPRISYESKKQVTKSTVEIASQYQTEWYVIRYYNQYTPSASATTGAKIFSAAFMTSTAWQAFLVAYGNLADDDRVIVSNCIIDVSVVRYLNTTAVTNLTPTMHLDFVGNLDPQSIGAGAVQVVLSQDATQLAYICKDPANAATLGSLVINIPTTNTGTYWELDAEREVYIPYIGAVKFRLADLGASVPSTVGIRIAYEPYSNAYVTTVAPQLAGAYTDRLPTMTVTKVDTAVPFRADSTFTNMGLARMQLATTTAGAIIGTAAGNPMGLLALPQAVGHYTQAQLAEATGVRTIGQPGGDPAYTAAVDATVVSVTVSQAIPREGYTDLWSALGMPDGAWRAFSALSGYAEIDQVELTGIGGGVDTLNEIRAQLAAGVYF